VGQLTFRGYLEKLHDWYEFDQYNERLIEVLNLYCNGDKEFERVKDKTYIFSDQQKLYLEKGLLIVGNVGTGKTLLLRLMNKFYHYTKRERLTFRTKNIPELADSFSTDGRAAFKFIDKGNWLFDEICFVDENTGKPDREMSMYFGDRILIGQKVIYDRYNIFVEEGWQSHFTTNANIGQIKEIYGSRVWSRLLEMVNILVYIGEDRRKNSRPHFYSNKTAGNAIEVQQPVKREEVQDDRQFLTESYLAFVRGGNWNFIYEFEYDKLKEIGLLVPDMEEYVTNLTIDNPNESLPAIRKMAKKLAVAHYYSSVREGKVQCFLTNKEM